MVMDEFLVLVKAMKAVWTDPKFIPDKDAVQTWYAILSDIPYEQASMALRTYMETENRTPTPADLRRKVGNLAPMGMTALEAWGIVRDAITRSGYYYNEEYTKLAPPIQKAVGCPENLRDWSQIETATLDTVIQSQFIKNYGVVQKRTDDAKITSPEVSARLGVLQQRILNPPQREALPEPKSCDFTPTMESRLNDLYRKLGSPL